MFRRILISIMFVCSAAQVSAAGLKVGVSGDYPPLIYKQEGRLVGIEADNAKAIGDILGQPMTLVEMPLKDLIPALQAGKIDVIMTGMSVTPERSKLVRFTEPYMEIGQMAIMTTENVGRFAQPWSIYGKGVRIGVKRDTTGSEFVENKLPDSAIMIYSDAESAFAGLRKGEIDVFIHDAPTSWMLATNADNADLISLYHPLTSEQLAWAVRKEDDVLAESLNQALRTIKGNGALRYILNRWIPVTVEVR